MGTFGDALGLSAGCTGCASGTFVSVVGSTSQTNCSLCSLGSFCPPASSTPVSCPRGSFAGVHGLGLCAPCPAGFSSSAASTACSACSSTDLCPLGSPQPLQGQSAVIVKPTPGQTASTLKTSFYDPLGTLLDNGGNAALKAQLAVGIIAISFMLLAGVFYFVSRRRTSVKECLLQLDAYQTQHYFPLGSSGVRKRKALGGLFTVFAICGLVTLCAVLIIQSQLNLQHSQGISPRSPPFAPVGLFNFSVRLVGAAGCQNAQISGPASGAVRGQATSGNQANSDGSLALFWACASCSATSSEFTISFGSSDAMCYAAALEFSASFPGYTTSASSQSATSPFLLSGALVPSQPYSTVFRGQASPTQLEFSTVPCYVHDGPQYVGSFAQLINVVPGPQANAVSAACVLLNYLFVH